VGETAAQAIAQSIMPPDCLLGDVSCSPAQCPMSGIPTVALCVMASPLDMAKGMNDRVKATHIAVTSRNSAKRPVP